jgi:hypothetical protein
MEASHEFWFDHEKLEVYREAIALMAWLSQRLESLGRVGDVRDQLDRASTSIALNIAGGNGKFSPRIAASSLIPPTPPRSNAPLGSTSW